MPTTISPIGAPAFIGAVDAADLQAKVIKARPGSVVSLLNTVAPFHLRIDQAKRSLHGHMVTVALPSDQVAAVTFKGPSLYTEVVGGVASADEVFPKNAKGEYDSNYSIEMLDGASHFAVRGMRLSQGYMSFGGGAGHTDFEITDCIVEWARNDIAQLVRCKRFLIDGLKGTRCVVKGFTMKFYDDGAPPVDAPPGNLGGGYDIDTLHNDSVQIRNEVGNAGVSEDFAIINCDLETFGAGFVAYGDTSSGGLRWRRALIANNKMRPYDKRAAWAIGTDIEVRGNQIGLHPVVTGRADPVELVLERINAGDRVRGGLNSSLEGSMLFTTASGVDLNGVVNGDIVTPPALPNLRRSPWAPTPVRPALPAYNQKPEMIGRPGLFYALGGVAYSAKHPTDAQPPSAPVGTWFTAGVGTVKGLENSTGEWRWTRDDVPIPGANGRTYQGTSSDIGSNRLKCQTRRTNAFGTSDWMDSYGVNVVA